jgi:hypothetical protein
MIVVIRGPLLSVTGYGCHTRQIWQWARSKPGWEVYANIVPWGICTYYVNPDDEGGVIGDIMSRSSTPPRKPDVTLQVQLPDEWDPDLGNINIGVTAGIEADKCSMKWISSCEKMDRVIVPSEYSKLAFINGGLKNEKIVNVPEAITCGFENTEETELFNNRLDQVETKFNFLVFGQLTSPNPSTDRKNTFNCIKWLCEEFAGKKDVGIILKTNLGRMTVEDRQATVTAIDRALSAVRKGAYPKLYVLHGLMDKNEVGALYQHDKVKALVAPTRGEGWGLPILDAAAAGLPVITTNHSGHMDFMKNIRFLDLRFNLVEIPESMEDGRIWVKGARWADPIENHFKSRVRKFHKEFHTPKQWALKGSGFIRDNFNIESVFTKYDEALGDLIDLS